MTRSIFPNKPGNLRINMASIHCELSHIQGETAACRMNSRNTRRRGRAKT